MQTLSQLIATRTVDKLVATAQLDMLRRKADFTISEEARTKIVEELDKVAQEA